MKEVLLIALGASWPLWLWFIPWLLELCQRLYRYSYSNMYILEFARVWIRVIWRKHHPHKKRYTPEHWQSMKGYLFKEYFVPRRYQYKLYLWNKTQFPK